MHISSSFQKSEVDGKLYPTFWNISTWVPTSEEIFFTLAWAIILTFMRLVVQKYFTGTGIRLKVKEPVKFSEACWKVFFYTISWSLGMVIVLNLGLISDTHLCWRGWPNIPLEWETKHYYLFQLGFYVHSLYAHFAYEVKRKDFWPLLTHHVVTILLIYFSYLVGLHRIGLLVLVCHDINDIIFEFGKTYVYQEKEPHTTISFIWIMIFWVLSRLIFYPFVVIKSVIFEALENIPSDVFPYHLQFVVCLSFLLCLHIYWFGLMVNMAHRVFTGKEKGVVDSREEDDNRHTVKKQK